MKNWAFYEGTTSSKTFLKDLSKLMTLSVKTEQIKDVDGTVLKEAEVVKERNWDVVFPTPQTDSLQISDYDNMTPSEFESKILNQLNQVNDTVILKTKTTPKDLSKYKTDILNIEEDLNVTSIEMFIELYKPKYIIDNEKYPIDCERDGILPYVVTKELYSEYAKSIGYKEFNIKDDDRSNPDVSVVNIQDPRVRTYTDFIDSGYYLTNASYIQFTKICKEILGATNNFGAIPYNLVGSFTSNVIAGSDLSAKLKNSSYAAWVCSVTGISMNLFEKYDLSFTLVTTYTWRGYGFDITITPTRSVEKYTINAGYQISPVESSNIDATTIKIKVGSTYLTSSEFSYDRSLNLLTINKQISGLTEVIGDPIINYEYKKNPLTAAEIAALGKNLIENNHCIYIRMFDKINSDLTGPLNTISESARVSEWSKMSWYKDFEEYLVDDLDDDIGNSNIADGIVNLPVSSPGLSNETRFKIWLNTNNDRALISLMGNPALDLTNNHLIGFAYIGQIESFENSINDTSGNFALTTSSSTVPCYTKSETKKYYYTDTSPIGVGDPSGATLNYSMTLDTGRFYDVNIPSIIELYNSATGTTATLTQGSGFTVSVNSDKTVISITLASAAPSGDEIRFQYNYYIEKVVFINGVTRDTFGNVIDTKFPETYGVNTATGVIDVNMYHTRSKMYFQKHQMLFTTTEEYMKKRLYGESAYTHSYLADQIKITHAVDGPRGLLSDILVVDASDLRPLMELIENKDFEKDTAKPEETYVYFPISAPFSALSDSPNALYGVAIKKDVRMYAPTTDEEAVNMALENLTLNVGNLQNLTSDVYLPNAGDNGVTVTWVSSDPAITII